ncbi:MFS transporter [Haloarcula nitratireducens]|uniref:MFS transporter n=1 Tax=Haloarcula nitratireducens TaxID=2487749 RepID=A0AAW4P8W1_9EURY|nr:MFS transporter [Halomicroarcula nitratireducens]MBX0294028.1 MFS transporter [Halomicroarcula nitratireducens]
MRELLSNRTFLRLLVGRLVTNAGDSIYYVAALWLVHDLTQSTFYTGVASFLVMVPGLLSFAVGPLVDDVEVRWALVVTQAVQGLLVLTIPAAAWFDALTVELVLVVIPLASLVNLMTYPAQSAALPRAVGRENLSSANAVFNTAHEGVNMAFNAVGGVLVGLAAIGAVGAFLVDAATFGVAILLFAGLALPERRGDPDGDGADADDANPGGEVTAAPDGGDTERAGADSESLRERTRRYVGDFRDGVDYLRGTAFVPVLLPQIFISFATGMMLAILPAFAELRGSAGLYGVLLSALAAGALVGSVLSARLDRVPYGYFMLGGTALTGLAWIGAGLATWTPVIVAFFALAIVYSGGNSVLFDTLVQTVVPEQKLGRVTSAMSTLGQVATPFGSLLGGAAAAVVGPVPIVLFVGGANFVGTLYFLISGSLRSLPSVANVEYGDERIEEFRSP